MAIEVEHGYPIALYIDSASPGEAKLVESTLAGRIVPNLPRRLIGDKSYDSDALDKKLSADHTIEMIAPNRRNRYKTQDRRKLRRYKRRFKVERFFLGYKATAI